MTFKSGQSGNPNGRPKGAVSRRVQLTKLLEPHAEALIQKVIALALEGEMNALRLCIERLLPKMHHSPVPISLDNLAAENITDLKKQIVQAALDGTINTAEAEGLIRLMSSQFSRHPAAIPTKLPIDPIEASRVYQEIMMRD